MTTYLSAKSSDQMLPVGNCIKLPYNSNFPPEVIMDKRCSGCGGLKDISHFTSGTNGKVTKMCEACREPRRRSMRKVPKEERTFRHQQWRYSNGRSKEYMADYNMRYHVGMGMEEFNLESATQEGLCKICQKPQTNGFERLCVDHDHETMQFRGLLCSKCNTAIGLLHEDPALFQRAHDYLEQGKTSARILQPIKQEIV